MTKLFSNAVVVCRPFNAKKAPEQAGFLIASLSLTPLEVVVDFKSGNDAYPEVMQGDTIYVLPDRKAQPWASKRFTMEGVQGEVILVPAGEIQVVKSCSH